MLGQSCCFLFLGYEKFLKILLLEEGIKLKINALKVPI